MFNYENGEILYEYNPHMFVKKNPIGSVFKIITTFLFLEKNSNILEYRYNCIKSSGEENLPCWNKKGHSIVNIESAFVNSCNKFFYSLKYSPKEIKNTLNKLGFNIDFDLLDFESSKNSSLMLAGNTPDIKADFYELSKLISVIANKGTIIDIKTKKNIYYVPQSKIINQIRSFMGNVVLKGTSKNVFYKAYGFSGKTGTAKDRYGVQNGLFIGFTKNKPYAIIVNIFNKIGSSSAMIASDVIYLYDLKL